MTAVMTRSMPVPHSDIFSAPALHPALAIMPNIVAQLGNAAVWRYVVFFAANIRARLRPAHLIQACMRLVHTT